MEQILCRKLWRLVYCAGCESLEPCFLPTANKPTITNSSRYKSFGGFLKQPFCHNKGTHLIATFKKLSPLWNFFPLPCVNDVLIRIYKEEKMPTCEGKPTKLLSLNDNGKDEKRWQHQPEPVGSVVAVRDEQKGKKIIDALVELLVQHRLEKIKDKMSFPLVIEYRCLHLTCDLNAPLWVRKQNTHLGGNQMCELGIEGTRIWGT